MLARARLGDKAALGRIIEAYYNDIYKFLARRMGDSFVAQDVTQETFMKFTRSLSAYTDTGKLRSYLFTVAVNCSNDWFRREKKTFFSDGSGLPEEECSDDIEAVFDRGEAARYVKAAVDGLPDWQRDVVILRYYHGMKLAEVARVLDIPLATVKTRLNRAGKVLENVLKGEFDEKRQNN